MQTVDYKTNRLLERRGKKGASSHYPASLNEDSKFHIFISYSLKDEGFVLDLDKGLRKSRRRAWLHRKDVQPTEKWLQSIYSGIEASDNFAFVISPDSIASPYCQNELDHAVKHNKRLIPMLRRDIDVKLLPTAIASLNWIDFRDNKNLNNSLKSLIKVLDINLSYVRDHTRFLTRAIEWETKGKDKSYLLRGSDLQEAERWLAETNVNEKPAPTPLQIEYIVASNNVQRKRRRITLATVTTALTIVSTLMVLYLYQRNQAREQSRIALARQLAAQSELVRNQGSTLLPTSVLLAIESLRQSPSLEADMALRHGLNILPRQIASVRLDGHPRAIAFSQDGKYMAITQGQNSRMQADDSTEPTSLVAWVLDATSRQQVMQIKHEGNVNAIAFSPESKLLATASDDHTTRIWEISSNREVMLLPHDEEVRNAIFSPDGKYLHTVSGNKRIKHLWEVATGTEIKNLKKNSYGEVDAFDVSNRYLLTISEDGLYLKKGKENLIVSRFIQRNKIERTYISPNGKYLAAVRDNYVPQFSEPVDYTIWIWDIEKGREVAHIKYDTGFLEKIVFCPTGKYFCVLGILGWGHADFVYKTEGAEQVMRLEPDGEISVISFSSDSKYLVTVIEDGTVRVLEVATRQEVARMIGDGNILSAAFSKDDKYITTTSDRGIAQIWSAVGGQEIVRIDDDRGDGYGDWRITTISSDGGYLSTIRSTIRPGEKYRDVFRVLEIASGNEVLQYRKECDGLNYRFSPDKRFIGMNTTDYYIRVWDSNTGIEIGAIEDRKNEKQGTFPWRQAFMITALSMDGKYVVADGIFSASNPRPRDLPVLVWDAQSNRVAMRLSHPGYIGSAEFSPDRKHLATAGKSVRIWDISSGQEVANLPCSGSILNFSPTGEFLLTISEESGLQIWEIKTRREIKEVNLEGARTSNVLSPDGKYLAVGKNDGTTEIWEIHSGKKIARLVHTDGVRPTTFSSDGAYLATSESGHPSERRQAVPHADVWEVSSGREVTHIEEQYGQIIHFTPDNKYLIVDSGQSLRVMLWRVDDLINEACKRLTRNFTPEEWRLYFGDEPYRKTCPSLP